MAFKLIVCFALLAAITNATPQHYQTHHHFANEQSSTPVLIKKIEVPHATYNNKVYEQEGPVHYDFSYAVNDEHTKDIKNQMESRKGDMVKGHYDMIDSDGFKRIVDYTADDNNGFQALVHREKTNIVVPIPVAVDHQKSYHHNTVYSPHSLQHHYMPLPVHSAQPHKSSATSYSIAKKPEVAHKYVVPVVKHITPKYVAPVAEHLTPKYVVPVVHHKTVTPIETPVTHFIAKPTNANYHADTHVSFHGVNAKYEY